MAEIVDVDGTGSMPGDPAAGLGVAFEAGSTGAVTVSGTDSRLLVRNGAASASGISVGYQGAGTLDVESGAVVRIDTGSGPDGGMTVGYGPGATGNARVTGAGSALELVGTGTGITVGYDGTGMLVFANGAAGGAQNGFVGLRGTGDGTIEVRDGATLTFAGTNPQLGFGGSLAWGSPGRRARGVERADRARQRCRHLAWPAGGWRAGMWWAVSVHGR